MFEKIRVANVMLFEVEVFGEMTYKFEKHAGKENGGVRVFQDGNEVDYFTNYSIGESLDKFEEACMNYLEEAFEE